MVTLEMHDLEIGDVVRFKPHLGTTKQRIVGKDKDGYLYEFVDKPGGNLFHTKNGSHPFFSTQYWERV